MKILLFLFFFHFSNVFAHRLDVHSYASLSNGSKSAGLVYQTPNIGLGLEYYYDQFLFKPYAFANIGRFDDSYIYDMSLGSLIGTNYQFGLGVIAQNYMKWSWAGPSNPFIEKRINDYGIAMIFKINFWSAMPMALNIYPNSGPMYKMTIGYSFDIK